MQNIGAVILAAGESSRFGRPKQLIQFGGQSLVRRIVDAADEAGCSPIIVVVGDDDEKNAIQSPHLHPLPLPRGEAIPDGTLADLIQCELEQTPAKIVKNRNWRAGIGTSICVGVQGLIDNEPTVETIVLLVCDQPFVDAEVIKKLIALQVQTKRAILASSYSDTLGVPALFDRSCFQELLALDDQSGAKKIIFSNRDRVAEFSFPEGKIDIDTVEDYEKLTQTGSSRME
jgi:molybdenum cofactor cytidylyltransferase